VLASPSNAEATFLRLRPTIERIVAFVARRHHASPEEAEDFGSLVSEKLIENDYLVIRKFQGRSTIETYLTTVILRLFLDFRNHEWGKWRPSAAARRGGRMAMLLDKYLTRDSIPLDQACELLRTNHGVSLDRSEIAQIAARLPRRSPRRHESDEVLSQMPARDRADQTMLERDREALWQRIMAVVAEVRVNLSPQDATIIALRFEDGRKVSEIAALLHTPQKPLYERVNRLLAHLRRELEKGGIDAETIQDLFDGD
jgi:RNA polymerase sigma factor (sigma-70 family)